MASVQRKSAPHSKQTQLRFAEDRLTATAALRGGKRAARERGERPGLGHYKAMRREKEKTDTLCVPKEGSGPPQWHVWTRVSHRDPQSKWRGM